MANTPLSHRDFSLEEKVLSIKKKFLTFSSPEQKYNEMMAMGRALLPLKSEEKTEKNLIRGCQSRLYLYSWGDKENIYFRAEADALISAGLAALLIAVYSGESAEVILKRPPDFLQELGIYASLSPNRSNGLAHIYLRMKQEALKILLDRKKQNSLV